MSQAEPAALSRWQRGVPEGFSGGGKFIHDRKMGESGGHGQLSRLAYSWGAKFLSCWRDPQVPVPGP